MTESVRNEEILNIIRPFYKKLIVILMRKSMQPCDMSDWSREDKDTFRCYRQDIEDTYVRMSNQSVAIQLFLIVCEVGYMLTFFSYNETFILHVDVLLRHTEIRIARNYRSTFERSSRRSYYTCRLEES